MKGMAINFSDANDATHKIKNVYRIPFLCNPQLLNFKANRGISAFSSIELTIVSPIKNHLFNIIPSTHSEY